MTPREALWVLVRARFGGLCSGLEQVHAHGGCTLSRLGVALRAALAHSHDDVVSEDRRRRKWS